MNASHILRRAALITSAVGLAGTALLVGGGSAYAAPGPDHDWNGRHDGDRSTVFEPRHPRQARHWDDQLERCNPSNCWRGVGSYWQYYHSRHHHRGHHHGGGDAD